MLVYMHAKCGKPALRLAARSLGAMPAILSKVGSASFLHLDGSPVLLGEKMCCDSCGTSLAGYGDKFPQRSQIKEVEE